MTEWCRTCGSQMIGDLRPSSGCSPCNGCRAFRKATWYAKNKRWLRKQKAEYMRQWRARNPGYRGRKAPQVYKPELASKHSKTYRSKPGVRERQLADNRAYYAANRERILAQKKARKLERVEIPHANR